MGVHDQSFSVTRMMPPGQVKYFFSVSGMNELDEYAPTVDTMKNQKAFDMLTVKKEIYIINENPKDEEMFTDKVIPGKKQELIKNFDFLLPEQNFKLLELEVPKTNIV